MDVAGPVPHSLREEEVHHLHDGGLAGHLRQIGEVGTVVDLGDVGVVGARQAAQDLLEEVLLDLLPYQSGVGEDGDNRSPHEDAQVVHPLQRRRRAHRHDQRLAIHPDRQNLVPQGIVARREGHSRRIRANLAQIYERKAKLTRQKTQPRWPTRAAVR